MSEVFLGIDGGGTKTAFIAIDEQANVLGEYITGTSYYVEIGLDQSAKILQQGVEEVLRLANKSINDVSFAFFGLPAFGEDSKQVEALSRLPERFLPPHKFTCDNDMVNSWAAAFACRDGINIIAGTGAIAYGVNDQKRARCSGWGEMFGDEGSAFWIGCKGLGLFSKMSDGRLNKTPLYYIFKEAMALDYDLDMTAIVANVWNGERSKVASLCKLVFEAHQQDDPHASDLIIQAANELAQTIHTLSLQLGFTQSDNINISYSGGVFNAGDTILLPFKRYLESTGYQFNICAPVLTPVQGAALYASILANKRLSDEALNRLL